MLMPQLKMITIITLSNRKEFPISKSNFIRTWFSGATVYTCIDLSNRVTDEFFCGAQWPKLVGLVGMIAIRWGASSKLKELR